MKAYMLLSSGRGKVGQPEEGRGFYKQHMYAPRVFLSISSSFFNEGAIQCRALISYGPSHRML